MSKTLQGRIEGSPRHQAIMEVREMCEVNMHDSEEGYYTLAEQFFVPLRRDIPDGLHTRTLMVHLPFDWVCVCAVWVQPCGGMPRLRTFLLLLLILLLFSWSPDIQHVGLTARVVLFASV